MPKTRRDEIKEQFLNYHRNNPQVWKLFKQFSLELINSGRKLGSAHAVMHRIRWHHAVLTKDADEFKINNNYAAWYSRSFEKTFPKHAGFFKRRKQTSVNDPPKGRKIKHSQVAKPDPMPIDLTDDEADPKTA